MNIYEAIGTGKPFKLPQSKEWFVLGDNMDLGIEVDEGESEIDLLTRDDWIVRDDDRTASLLHTYKLCYVEDYRAYFTTQPLLEQWGDDWNDAPYEHNAGAPYEYGDHDRKEGRKAWDIISVFFTGNLDTPDEGYRNSPYSVEIINKGGVPWLATPDYVAGPKVSIYAGTSLPDFMSRINEAGGQVFMKVNHKFQVVLPNEEDPGQEGTGTNRMSRKLRIPNGGS